MHFESRYAPFFTLRYLYIGYISPHSIHHHIISFHLLHSISLPIPKTPQSFISKPVHHAGNHTRQLSEDSIVLSLQESISIFDATLGFGGIPEIDLAFTEHMGRSGQVPASIPFTAVPGPSLESAQATNAQTT